VFPDLPGEDRDALDHVPGEEQDALADGVVGALDLGDLVGLLDVPHDAGAHDGAVVRDGLLAALPVREVPQGDLAGLGALVTLGRGHRGRSDELGGVPRGAVDGLDVLVAARLGLGELLEESAVVALQGDDALSQLLVRGHCFGLALHGLGIKPLRFLVQRYEDGALVAVGLAPAPDGRLGRLDAVEDEVRSGGLVADLGVHQDLVDPLDVGGFGQGAQGGSSRRGLVVPDLPARR
jgi:hypothetical protein